MATETKPTLIRSVARASRILLHLARQGDPATAKETAAALDMHIATTYHLLNTLVAEGLVTKDAGRRYTLGPRVGELSDAFDRQLAPPEILLVGLRRLAQDCGETSYLSAWRQGEISVLASIEGSHAVRVGVLHRGMRGDAHARASGKLLLAHATAEARDAYFAKHPIRSVTPHTIVDLDDLNAEFQRIRDRGYSTDDGEFAEGVACASAPVTSNGQVTAAFTVSAPTGRFAETQDDLIAQLVQAAKAASTQ
jgi:DNA-binding IclR family transcriptional regulator